MLKTTTSSVDGREIGDYLDIVVGEAILGANVFKDMFGAFRDIVGGRSGAYEREMGRARQIAFAEMEAEAAKLGADGIVGIDIDYEVVGEKGGMMMVVPPFRALRDSGAPPPRRWRRPGDPWGPQPPSASGSHIDTAGT